MHDQADQLRKLVRDAVDHYGDLAPGAPLIAISGAAPRVGATTVACGLARELASLGKQVVLVDANLTTPSIAAAIGVKPAGTLADVLSGNRRAVEILTSPAENIRVLAGAPLVESTNLDLEALASFVGELAALGRQADVVLLDVGGGMSPWIDRLWQLAQQVLLVTTPASQAVLDAYATLKQSHHEGIGGKLQLVVTRCDAAADAACIHAGFSDTCERFLAQTIKAPAVLPTMAPPDAAAFARSVRILAADLACDFRSLAGRLPSRRGSGQLPPSGARFTVPANPVTPRSPEGSGR